MKKGIKIAGIVILILGFWFLIGVFLTTIRVEIFRYDSEDKQYSVIIKGNLLDNFMSFFADDMYGMFGYDDWGCEVLVVDNVENKTIDRGQFFLRPMIEFKTDTIYLRYGGYYYDTILPRSIKK